MQTVQKLNKVIVPIEKLNLKLHHQKTTPLGKTKIQLPMSVSRIPQTPSNLVTTNVRIFLFYFDFTFFDLLL